MVTHIALVPYQVSIDASLLTRVAAALQRQVHEHFGPAWRIEAQVSPFVDWNAVPPDYARLIVVDHLDSTALGVHADKDGKPYALVGAHGNWPLVASHECLEMLADPTGKQVRHGPSPKQDGRTVEILVEVCDPCQGSRWSYEIDGIPVSDFCTPAYYDGGAGPWSHCGHIKAAHEVLKDGYLIWHDPAAQEWWRRDCLGTTPTDYALGPIPPTVSFLRGHIDRITKRHRQAHREDRPFTAPVSAAARARAAALGEELTAMLGSQVASASSAAPRRAAAATTPAPVAKPAAASKSSRSAKSGAASKPSPSPKSSRAPRSSSPPSAKSGGTSKASPSARSSHQASKSSPSAKSRRFSRWSQPRSGKSGKAHA